MAVLCSLSISSYSRVDSSSSRRNVVGACFFSMFLVAYTEAVSFLLFQFNIKVQSAVFFGSIESNLARQRQQQQQPLMTTLTLTSIDSMRELLLLN